jgi:hypothetical protein
MDGVTAAQRHKLMCLQWYGVNTNNGGQCGFLICPLTEQLPLQFGWVQQRAALYMVHLHLKHMQSMQPLYKLMPCRAQAPTQAQSTALHLHCCSITAAEDTLQQSSTAADCDNRNYHNRHSRVQK